MEEGLLEIVDLYWFGCSYIIVYLLYLIFYVLRYKKFDKNKTTIEIVFLVKKYNLDMAKINYRVLLNTIGLVAAFDLAFVSTFVLIFIKNVYIAILVGALMLVPIIIITFGFIGKYYTKKGLIKNDKYKKNRK